jgi:glucose/arabinose dehydrogenase
MEPAQNPQSLPQQFPPQEPVKDHSHKGKWFLAVCGLLVAVLIGVGMYLWQKDDTDDSKTPAQASTAPETDASEVPELKTETLLDGRTKVWDMGFLPSGQLIFTEKTGTVSLLEDGSAKTIADISDVVSLGEGGLLGMAVDPKFNENRYIYTCFNTSSDIRVVRWVLDQNVSSLGDRKDIVTGMPRNPSGRHSGCRLAFSNDGYLWIGTGDTAQDLTPQTPQDPNSLGGKILRVDRNGQAAAGNLTGAFDRRIYSYGHRNTQGLAFFEKPINGVPGISVEHGSDVDDEVNLLKPGNFGWAPPDGEYDESVPMTDTERFPDAVRAIWTSGDPTQAPSGAAMVYGSKWKAWNGAIAVAVLKDQHLKFLTINDKLEVTKEDRMFEGDFGRLRMARLGPDGSLYLSTDNGANDKIIRVSPQ